MGILFGDPVGEIKYDPAGRQYDIKEQAFQRRDDPYWRQQIQQGLTGAQYAGTDWLGRQKRLASQLEQRAAGKGGPSVAEQQMMAGLERQRAGAQSMAAGMRGVPQGLAQYLAMQQMGQAGRETSQAAGQLRAQEQLAAQQALGQLAGQGLAQAQQMQQFLMSQGMSADQAAMQAQMALEELRAQQQAGIQAMEFEQARWDAQRQASEGLIGPLMGTVGTVGGFLAGGPLGAGIGGAVGSGLGESWKAFR